MKNNQEMVPNSFEQFPFKSRKKRPRGFFAVPIIIVCFLITFVCADLFSSAITIGNFAFSLTTSSKNNGYNIFGLYALQTNQESVAISKCDDIKTKNGAGFIWHDDIYYYALHSMYLEENDAKKVLDVFNNNGISGYGIHKFSIPTISVETSITNTNKNILYSIVTSFKNAYMSIYDVSVSLETNIINESEAIIGLNNALEEIENQKKKFNSAFNSQLTNSLIYIKLGLADAELVIEQTIQKAKNNSFLAEIKYCYCKIAKLQKDVYDNINKKL